MKDLATSLIEYVEQGIVPMHMPGHKRNFEGFPRDCYEFDVTEVNDHYVIGMLGGCGCGSKEKH